jgi:hypothetical protein
MKINKGYKFLELDKFKEILYILGHEYSERYLESKNTFSNSYIINRYEKKDDKSIYLVIYWVIPNSALSSSQFTTLCSPYAFCE